MITFNITNFKTNTETYNNFIANIEVKTIKCPTCGKCDMHRHGYYKRYINISGIKVKIRILRVKCTRCGHTHAVLPDFVVPYLHEPILNILTIVNTSNYCDLEEHTIKIIKKIIKRFKPILNSLGLTFQDKLQELVFSISKRFQRCLFQIHRGKYYYTNTSHII